jgi:1-acyl-sn-glycerol-3-phosphate acyltransferase
LTPSIPDAPTVVGTNLPRRGNALTRGFWRMALRLFGWRMVGNPPDVPKFLMTAAPHTSNLDGLLLMFGAFAVGIEQHWVIKHSMMRGWRAPLLRFTGAVGVDRSRGGNLVQGVLDQYQQRERFILTIAPEGTRRRVETWKSGFYRIAQRAQVPVCLGFIDYKHRLIGFGPSFVPSGDYARDLALMSAFYAQITPRYPKLFAVPTRLAE